MNLNIDTIGNRAGAGRVAGVADGNAAPKASAPQHRSVLTISNAAASADEIAAAEIDYPALSRDDDLGALVSAAFGLPAPPMPNFGSEAWAPQALRRSRGLPECAHGHAKALPEEVFQVICVAETAGFGYRVGLVARFREPPAHLVQPPLRYRLQNAAPLQLAEP